MIGIGLGGLLVLKDIGFGWVLLLLGVAFALWAYFHRQSKHWVRIGTAGAEANAVWSMDRAWTVRVVEALNNAIIARG